MAVILTAAQILERQQATAAAEARAAADPSSVTDADLKDLTPETLGNMMAAGQLTHLGIGKARGTRRRS